MEIVLDQLVSSITDLSGIFHYEGSLTTPGCAELVQWIVMETPMHIRSKGLLPALRKNLDSKGDVLQDNYRPTQGINGRNVYHYQPGMADDSSSGMTDEAPWCANSMSRSQYEVSGEILMIIYQDDPSFFDTSSAELKTIEFQSLDNTTTVSTVAACLTPAPKPLPMPNEQIDGGALHVLDDGTILYCAWAKFAGHDEGGCLTYDTGASTWTKIGDRTQLNFPGLFPAHDYHPDVGLMVVVGGTDGTNELNSTEIYDVNSGSWSAGEDFPVETQNHGTTHYRDSFIVAGGFLATTGDVYFYDIVNNGTWTKLNGVAIGADAAVGGATCSNAVCNSPALALLDSTSVC